MSALVMACIRLALSEDMHGTHWRDSSHEPDGKWVRSHRGKRVRCCAFGAGIKRESTDLIQKSRYNEGPVVLLKVRNEVLEQLEVDRRRTADTRWTRRFQSAWGNLMRPACWPARTPG